MKKISLSLAAIFLLSSCAGIISGKNQNIYLVPTNASTETVEVKVQNNAGMAQTIDIPGTISVKRQESVLIIEVKNSKCYKSTKTYSTPKYNVMLASNAVGGLFGITGTAMDLESGAAWSYDNTIYVNTKETGRCK